MTARQIKISQQVRVCMWLICVCKWGTGVDDWSVPGMRENVKRSPNGNWLVFRWWFPLVVRRRRYGSLLCNRALPLRAAPDARKQAAPGSSPRSRGRFLRMHPVNSSVSVGSRISLRDPGMLLRTEPLPVNQILESAAPAVWSLATRALCRPHRRPPRKAGGSAAGLPPQSLLSDHQRVWEVIHECGEIR